jgi:hypothetical protein
MVEHRVTAMLLLGVMVGLVKQLALHGWKYIKGLRQSTKKPPAFEAGGYKPVSVLGLDEPFELIQILFVTHPDAHISSMGQ